MPENHEEQFVALLSYSCDDNPELVQPITQDDFDRMAKINDFIRDAEMSVFMDFKQALRRVKSNPEHVKTMMALSKV